MLAGCASYQADWPSLTGELPGGKERERVLTRIEPVPYEAPSPPALVNGADARQLLDAINKDIKADRARFETAFKDFSALEGAERHDAWFGLQVYLTRLSHTISRLDSLLHPDIATQFANVHEAAKKLKTEEEARVITARQTLLSLEPA